MLLNSFEGSRVHRRTAARYLPGGVSSNFRLGMHPTHLLVCSCARLTNSREIASPRWYRARVPLSWFHNYRSHVAYRHNFDF
jgi:hypothetical protein